MAAHMQQWELYSALNRECADVPDLDEQWQELSDRLELSGHDAEPAVRRSVITRFTPFVKWVVGIAAMVALIVGLRLWVDHNAVSTAQSGADYDITAKNDITEVTLTTADGKSREMSGHDMTINKPAERAASSRMLALTTPRGKDYHLTMADGTQVWLNADSRLEFPEAFGSDKREVKLKGEAYFEVAKDTQRPFVVHTDFITTQVLGTAFNVKAYSMRDAAVTLVEGVVRVKAGSESRQLVPGQQAAIKQAHLRVAQVDTYPYIQWKEGFLYYDNATLFTIMQDLARWYNVNVSFDDTSKMQLRLHFVVERSKSLDEAISSLNSLGEVHVQREGNVIVID